MRKIGFLLAASAAASVATPAHALVTIFTSNSSAVPSYINTNGAFSQDFGTAVPAVSGAFTAFTGASGPLATETKTGNVRIYDATSGDSVRPANATGDWLAIRRNASYNIAFTTGVSAISFVLGSLDPQNSIRLTVGSVVTTLTGGQIIGLASPSSGNASFGRVTYDFGTGPQLTNIEFLSGNNSFEIDSIVAAAPEPASWLMMILGFGLVGGLLRRRRAMGTLAAA